MGNWCSRHHSEPGPRADSDCRILLPQLHTEAVLGLASAGPGQVLTASEDGTLALTAWTADPPRVLEQWRGHTKSVTRVAHLPGPDPRFMSGSRDNTVRVWRCGDPKPVAVLEGHSMAVTGLAVVQEQGWACSGSRDYSTRLWDLAASRPVFWRELTGNVVTYMARVPREAAVLQCSEDLVLRLWDLRGAAVAQAVPGHTDIPLCCDVSPDGLYFVTSCNGFDGEGCRVRIWDRRMGRELTSCAGHTQAVGCCAFLPPSNTGGTTEAGLRVASGSADRTLRIWDAVSGECLCTTRFLARQDDAPITCMALLERECSEADGQPRGEAGTEAASSTVLCAANFAGVVHIWDTGLLKASTNSPKLLCHTPQLASQTGEI